MTNKKFKLAAMSLATAVAVSTVGPSASAVTYYLSDGSVTVDQDNMARTVIRIRLMAKQRMSMWMRIPKTMAKSSSSRQKTQQQTQQRVIPSLWKKMSRTKMANAMWISSLTA